MKNKSRHPVTCQYVTKTLSPPTRELKSRDLIKNCEAFQVHQLSPNVHPLDTAKRQVKNSTSQLRDCCLCSSYDFPQSPEHCSPTKYARVSRCSHGNVVMLFCPSFTQSERFLQTDQLIIRLQVVVVTNFIRMLMRNVFVNVFKSDAVIWWAAIFCTPSSMFDKLLHLS